MTEALYGARIFDGTSFLDGHALIHEAGRITAVLPAKETARDQRKTILNGGILAPGFIDAQVNGGGGILFNNHPDIEGIRAIAKAHRRFGTTGLLPTLITDEEPVIHAAMAAAQEATGTVPGCLGLHLEGPFLAPGRKGAHNAEFMRPMQDSDIPWLIGMKTGRLLLTVATEQVSPQQIRQLTQAGVIVSLGHTDADHFAVRAATEAGATGVTHLFNAMSQMSSREPGLAGSALDDARLWCSIIADGHHVHPQNLGLALRAKNRSKPADGRIFLVTDAMSAVGWQGESFTLNGREIRRRNGRLTLADGTLAGSDIDMASAVRYCIHQLGVSVQEALRMASLYPAQFLGFSRQRGRIRKGMIADLVHLDDAMQVKGTWIAGQFSDA